MHTEKRDAPDPSKGYETRDVNFKGLMRANLIFAAFAIGSAAIGYLLYIYWANPSIYHNPDRAVERIIPKDPFPLLQDNMTAKTDIMDMRQAEDHRLGGAPVQKEDGSYTIPIEAAKTLVLEGAKPGFVSPPEGYVSPPEKLKVEATVGQSAPTQGMPEAPIGGTPPLPSGTGENH